MPSSGCSRSLIAAAGCRPALPGSISTCAPLGIGRHGAPQAHQPRHEAQLQAAARRGVLYGARLTHGKGSRPQRQPSRLSDLCLLPASLGLRPPRPSCQYTGARSWPQALGEGPGGGPPAASRALGASCFLGGPPRAASFRPTVCCRPSTTGAVVGALGRCSASSGNG